MHTSGDIIAFIPRLQIMGVSLAKLFRVRIEAAFPKLGVVKEGT